MANSIYCHICLDYYNNYEDKKTQAVDDGLRFEDRDGSVGMGRTVIRRCPKGHMLDVGNVLGMHGSISSRRV